jgi:hypothetical protein
VKYKPNKINKMSEIKFKYAKGRFLNPNKVVDASVYSKQLPEVDDQGKNKIVWRVAISMDVINKESSVLYSDGFATEQEAERFAMTVPMD